MSISSVSWNTALTMNESLLLNGKSCAQSGNTRTHLVCRIAMEEMLDRSLLGNAPNRLLGVPATGRLLINVSPVGTRFDTYFGRYKGLLCRYVLDQFLFSLSFSRAISIHCLIVGTADWILPSSGGANYRFGIILPPISCQALHRSISAYYANCRSLSQLR